jgi:hypothetical protein
MHDAKPPRNNMLKNREAALPGGVACWFLSTNPNAEGQTPSPAGATGVALSEPLAGTWALTNASSILE